jgi:hypothetical protein
MKSKIFFGLLILCLSLVSISAVSWSYITPNQNLNESSSNETYFWQGYTPQTYNTTFISWLPSWVTNNFYPRNLNPSGYYNVTTLPAVVLNDTLQTVTERGATTNKIVIFFNNSWFNHDIYINDTGQTGYGANVNVVHGNANINGSVNATSNCINDATCDVTGWFKNRVNVNSFFNGFNCFGSNDPALCTDAYNNFANRFVGSCIGGGGTYGYVANFVSCIATQLRVNMATSDNSRGLGFGYITNYAYFQIYGDPSFNEVFKIIGGSGQDTVAVYMRDLYLSRNAFISGNAYLVDNKKLVLGTGNDATIYYDTVNLIVNPKEGGIGDLKILGNTNLTGYNLTATNYLNASGIAGIGGTYYYTNRTGGNCSQVFSQGLLMSASGCD